MHTPAGYAINEAGQFVPEDWLAIIFNPSFPYRLFHMSTAAFLSTALVVGATGAWHLLKNSANAEARTMFAMAMGMIVVTAPIQLFFGDQHGLNSFAHQPAKIMALEGHFKSHPEGAPFVLFGFPDQDAGEVRAAVEIPKLGSLLLKHDPNAPLAGLDTVDRNDWPPVAIIFWSFRIMVGLGLLMILLGLLALAARMRVPVVFVLGLLGGNAGLLGHRPRVLGVAAGGLRVASRGFAFDPEGLARLAQQREVDAETAVGGLRAGD